MAKHKRLKSIGDYLYDKGEMIEQLFSSIPIVEIRNMVPMKLQGMPLHELKAECLVELLGISDREILNIVEGKKERHLSSSDSDLEGAFVISDEEDKASKRRIKKEKKDTLRKVKTERVSSRKSDTSQKLTQPSTSKKKRKSKEIVEVDSKKKKKPAEGPVIVPSSSRDAPKVPVSKKKKNKKIEKKKDSLKNNEDDDIVVLDDSDKEEKHEQKSLLDLLELEMRARAIRSLLKKEEAVQAQKVLSEYKDEPDDLIPVEVEPPHIELLSDSEEETANISDVGAEESTHFEKVTEGSSSKVADDCIDNDDFTSGPPLDLSNDDSNSASSKEPMTSCTAKNDTPKANIEEAKIDSIPNKDGSSQENDEVDLSLDTSDCNDKIQSLSPDVTSATAGESTNASQSIPPSTSCISKGKQDQESIDGESKTSSCTDLQKKEEFLAEDLENEIDTDHFLVFEEPSMADGSETKESLIETEKETVETTKLIESSETVNALVSHEELAQPNSGHISQNTEKSHVTETVAATSLVPTFEDGTNCEAQVSHTFTIVADEDMNSKCEDEVLEYDYNSSNVFSEQVEQASLLHPENRSDSMTDCATRSSESNCSDVKLDQNKGLPHQGVDAPETIPYTADDEVCASGESSSVSTCLLGKQLLGTDSVEENITDSTVGSSFIAEILTENQLETFKPEDDVDSPAACSLGLKTIADQNTKTTDVPEGLTPKENDLLGSASDILCTGCKGSDAFLKKDIGISEENTITSGGTRGTTSCCKLDINGPAPTKYAEQQEKSTAEADSSFRPDSNVEVSSQFDHTTTLSEDSNIAVSPTTIDNFHVPQTTGCPDSSTVNAPEILALSDGGESVGEPMGLQAVESLHAHMKNTGDSSKVGSSSPQNGSADIAEIIDITDEGLDNNSEVVRDGGGRDESDFLEGSDHEISDKAALILERMNTILNEDVDDVSASSAESCNSSPNIAREIPAEIQMVNIDSSDDGSENCASFEGEGDVILADIVDLNDTNEEDESSGGGTSDSDDEGSYEGSNETLHDSDSLCSVESQENLSETNKSITAVHPKQVDECILVTDPEDNYCNSVVVIDHSSSESDDCAIVQTADDSNIVEPVVNVEGPEVEVFSSTTEETSTIIPDKDTVSTKIQEDVVTIVIEDDDGEVQLLSQEVPAEILELDDDDEVKSNWTARWLESDNVKKVVKTSKILANVRKQMKMKLKKVVAPVIEGPKPPGEKSAPPLIGSVEEYHRLVKEGVIVSKAAPTGEKQESAKSPQLDACKESSVTEPIVSTDACKEYSVNEPIVSTVTEETEVKSDRKKPKSKQKREKSERPRKPERRKKSTDSKNTSSEKSLSDLSVLESSSSFVTKGIDHLSSVTEKCGISSTLDTTTKVAALEDSEIVGSAQSKVSLAIGNLDESKNAKKNSTNKVEDKQSSRKDDDDEELEEGEICDKEEGELSDSDEDNGGSQKNSQPEPKAPSGSMKCAPPLSPIPLPQNPPAKKPSSKPPERNSAAKRIILRSLQLGKKKPANSKNKKKKRRKGAGGGNKKGLGYSSNNVPMKKNVALPQADGIYEQACALNSISSSYQAVTNTQPSYPEPALPGSAISQLGEAPSVNANTTAQMHDSYYSWAYSQGLISSANGNYGYGTQESIPDPNVYKQWEEYYRKLMEACKVSAQHASASTLYNVSSPSCTTEKSEYTWVFDRTTSTSQPEQIQASADSTTEPSVQVPAAAPSDDASQVGPDIAPVTNPMSDKERFESWQYRYGLKGLLKEHFIPAPGAQPAGGQDQKP